ncbi:ATP-binding cassette domain-containing protein [Nakamurella antarctica]|uniref:ATP-binding cassette domain-containing protein n=1 Tax=Nakamurella antarctica TaxID=1902245 RepID=A0A3G8ZT34_9ACTN|nr:dipeptide/oligopeptide/nickel ABC transporter permease/ATP-binding protein [Nakamurella antarctica]AZI57216.1 ATP-binding cassette domain-containing protein [Nakamurella antarctica]
MTVPLDETVSGPVAAESLPQRRRLKAFLRNPVGVVAASVLLLIVLLCLLAPLIAPYDPLRITLIDQLKPISWQHWLGTDTQGRDVLSRLLYGGRVSLRAGIIMISTAMAIGVPTGLLAGYYSKWFDSLASWVAGLLMSLPQILILVVVISSLGSGLAPTMIALGVLASPDIFRLTRGVVIGVRDELFIDAARVSGLSDPRIIFRHVLAVVTGPVVVLGSFVFGLAIIVQAGLEFLGFGDPTRPSWGNMLSDAFATIYKAPHLVYAPGAMIGVTAMCLVLVSAAIADSLGVGRASRRKRNHRMPARHQDAGRDWQQRELADDGMEYSAGDLLTVRGLSVRYPSAGGGRSTVVSSVCLTVNRGEALGIVGESGSGKSQTVFAILGLLPPEAQMDAQSMVLGGVNLIDASAKTLQQLRGGAMAYVPQEPMSNLDPSFTVGSQLIAPMRYKLKISKSAARSRAIALLERVGIPDPQRTMAAYPHELSGGMAQRVLIAGAVSCDPELLVADEPTTALDVTVQAEVLELLRELQKERNMALIIVTHNLGVIADICDRVAVMKSGEIVETASVAELFAHPQHEYTKMLLAATLDDAPGRAASAPPTGFAP